MVTQRGSVLPAQEGFSQVVRPGKTANITIAAPIGGQVYRVEVPDFAKTISVKISFSASRIAVDENPETDSLVPALDIFVDDMSIGLNIAAGAVANGQVFCFDIHGKNFKELRILLPSITMRAFVSFY